MVKSIGIDPGDHAVKVVELDGSYRKTRLLRVHVAAPAGATHQEGVATVVRAALDEGMRGDATLGHPCREAVLRTIELPFQGRDAIRKVVKSEIEGEIQSQSVDDMVVDFHEVGPGVAGGTRVLVASVPKPGLRTQLAALAAAGIEPESVDLDTMALWRAAHWAGAFAPDEHDAAAAEAGGGVTAVVDVGARSVRIVLVDGEHLVEMRALRLGHGAVGDEVARRHGLDAATARDVAHRCLVSGTDQRLEVPVVVPAPADGAPVAAEPPPLRAVVVRHAEVEAAHAAFLQRLARELTRFLTASGRSGQLRRLWITGGGSGAAGMRAMLAEVFGVEPQPLDLLGRMQHELPPEQVEELGPRLATAVGLALGRLGGPDGFELRQEDLVLTRGFERIKFPLAIACMVALLALFVHGNKKAIELKNLELQIGATFVDRGNPKAVPLFYGMLNSVFNSGWFDNVQHFRLEQSRGKDYLYKDLVAELVAAPVHRRIAIVRDRLKAVADQKQKDSGIYEDVSLESGLAVMVRWAELMKSVEPQLGRFLVPKVELTMRAPNRRLEFTIAFRGEDFRSKRSLLQRAIDAELQRPDTPFQTPERSEERKDEELFRDSAETGVVGAYYKVTLHVRDVFQPFGPSGSAVIGAGPARVVDGVGRDQVARTEGR